MKCWNCGFENEDGSRFCNTCAAPQSQEAYEEYQRAFAAQRHDTIEDVYLIYIKMSLLALMIGTVMIIIVLLSGQP